MARFLSPEWFAEVAAAAGPTGGEPAEVVLEQVVEGSPEGPTRYRVEISSGRARIVWPVADEAPPADLRITSDWTTAVALARGELSTQTALMQGRLRMSGNPQRLADTAAALEGVDPVPPTVRASTTFAAAS